MKTLFVVLAGRTVAVLMFFVVAVGTTLILTQLGIDREVAAVLGMVCWWAFRFLVGKHLKRENAARSVPPSEGGTK